MSLTSVFGMGTGGPSSQSAPTEKSIRLLYKTVYTVLLTNIQLNGDPYEIRTRVAGVRGRSLRPLDQRAEWYTIRDSNPGHPD